MLQARDGPVHGEERRSISIPRRKGTLFKPSGETDGEERPSRREVEAADEADRRALPIEEARAALEDAQPKADAAAKLKQFKEKLESVRANKKKKLGKRDI